jgi:SOS response regulatory protein OraA/RecX
MNSRIHRYFLDLLTGKDYSKEELLNKAYVKGFEENESLEVISYLEEKKIIDDKRLGENIIYKYQGQKGPAWLQQKLRQRKIPEELFLGLLANVTEKVDKNIQKKLEKKYHIENWNSLDFRTKQKVLAFLGRQGFTDPYRILQEWSCDPKN